MKRITKKQHRHAAAEKDLHGGYSVRMLRDTERELLAEVWRKDGFRITASLAGISTRWDIIYKMLLTCDYCIITSPTRGKAMKNLGLPEQIAKQMQDNRISLRKWCNAYGQDECETVSEMHKLTRGEYGIPGGTLYLERDFPCIGRYGKQAIDIVPRNYLYGDINIRQGYGQYLAIARMRSGIPVEAGGESIEEAVFILKRKAAMITRISTLHHRLYGCFPVISELVQQVEAPVFSAAIDVDIARAAGIDGVANQQ